jgi:glycosyltransferase involved in cell wall biosynthesis
MVSVVIPTYNRAPFIAETIASVLAQTHREVEIIVVDDGSTDNTAEVVARFGERVRYVWQQNSERSVTRNHGLELSRGEFVSFLDSDDCWLPEALDELAGALNAEPAAGLAAAGCAIVREDGQVLDLFYPGGGVEGILPDGFRELLRTNLIGSPSAVLLRRSALDKAGRFDEDRRLLGVEDWELWARIAFHAPVLCHRRPLVRYRRHRSNTPLPVMRLRYPWVVEALLRNLPLSPAQREEVASLGAQRLVEYAEELAHIHQTEAARHCLDAAARLHAPIAGMAAYREMVAAM